MAPFAKKLKAAGEEAAALRNLHETLQRPPSAGGGFGKEFSGSVGIGGSDGGVSDLLQGASNHKSSFPADEGTSVESEVTSRGQQLRDDPASSSVRRNADLISTLLEIQQSTAESLYAVLFGESRTSATTPSLAASLAKSFVLLKSLIDREIEHTDLRREVNSKEPSNVETLQPTLDFAAPSETCDPQFIPPGGMEAPLEESSSCGDMGPWVKWTSTLRSTISSPPQESTKNSSELGVPSWVESNFHLKAQLQSVDAECRRTAGRPSVIQGPRSQVNNWDSVPPNIFHGRRFHGVSPNEEDGHLEIRRKVGSPLSTEGNEGESHFAGIPTVSPNSPVFKFLSIFPGEMSTLL